MAMSLFTFRFLSLLCLLLAISAVDAAPKRKSNNAANGNAATTSQTTGATTKATGAGTGAAAGAAAGGAATAAAATKITTATDGSKILDKTVIVNGLSLRYKISAPADQFTTTSGVPGGAAAPNTTTGTNGLNVLLHGDGGQSFIDMPNQAVQSSLMGVVILAPNKNLFWGGGSGLSRTDGVAHAAAVDKLIQTQIPQDVAVNMNNTHFTGVSGGSLLLSGFFMPAFGAKYATAGTTGVMLMCGGMEPQVAVVNPTALAQARIHFQSTTHELALLQPSIPKSVVAYEKIATTAGLTAAQIGALQTVDNSPVGGHCEFDGQGFVSGIQVMSTAYASVMQGGTGVVTGLQGAGNVLKTVVGNEKLVFDKAAKRGMEMTVF